MSLTLEQVFPIVEANLTIEEGIKKDIAGGANTVLVGMTATNDAVIPTGVYSFDVPLTITCK